MSYTTSLKNVLHKIFIKAERTAVNSYSTWDGSNWSFNDSIWLENDEDADSLILARILLGLPPFEFVGAEVPREDLREQPIE